MARSEPHPAILEIARAIARGMAREDYAKALAANSSVETRKVAAMENEGVTIFDGRTRLSLIPNGPAGLGYPMRVRITSGSSAVAVDGEARLNNQFQQSLKTINDTLKGEAELAFWSEQHSIIFTASGKGDLRLVANVYEGSPWHARLTVEMTLDQSYLPEIMQGFARCFPGVAS